MIQEACKYAQLGWKIFPLKQGTKLPKIKDWVNQATDDVEQVIQWWTEFPNANIAVATGAGSGIWVLDIDVKGEENGVTSLQSFVHKYGGFPKTLCAKTASGGWHYFFKHDGTKFRNTAGRIPGVDTRGDGGYIVLAPSTLHDKSTYSWSNYGERISEAPGWLKEELLAKKSSSVTRRSTERSTGNTTAKTGSRNNHLTSLAGKYRRVGLDADAILNQLLKDNETHCKPPLDREEVEVIAESVARYEPELPDEEKDYSKLLKHVNPLGVHEGNYVFYSRNIKCIKEIAPATLLTNATLYSIIGLDLLKEFFPKVNQDTGEIIGFNSNKAGLYLMDQCHKRGKYNPDLMRGVGVWKDGKQIVVNTGTELIVDGQEQSYDQFESEYTYDQPDKKLISLENNLSQKDINKIFDIINGFNWVEDYAPYLLLGTLIQAVIGPVFRWRAHSWIIGAQGSGKSYIQFNLIRPLLGALCRGFEHGTTSSGIRGTLKHNAYTVSYDEAEVRDGDDPRIMNQVVALARISSSEESTVVKGTASGDSIEYRCQSTFIMSSIKPYLKQESDMARFALLEMEPPRERSSEEADAFEKIALKCHDITEDFSQRFVSSCVSLIPQIETKRRSIETQMVKMGLSPRACDQYGQLVACACAALGKDIDLDVFKSVLDETRELTADAEPIRELNRLLGCEIGIPTNYGREIVTVQKAIDLAGKAWIDDKKYIPVDINALLCSYGIKVEGGYVYIANTSPKLQDLMGYTNWNKLFKIIPWVEAGKTSTTFGNRTYKCRYVRFRSTVLVNENDPVNVLKNENVDPKPAPRIPF